MTGTTNLPVGDSSLPVQALKLLHDTGPVTDILLALLPPKIPPDISQARLTQDAASAITEVVRKTASEYVEYEIIGYQPSGSPADGQVMWMNIQDVPLFGQLFSDFEDLANVPLWNPINSNFKHLRFAAIRAEAGTSYAIFLQYLPTNQVVARTKRLGLIFQGNTLDIPKGEIVMLGNDFIAVVIGPFVFFKNRKAFQQLFGLMEEMRQQANETFAAVTAQLHIDGIEQMLQAVIGSPAMLGKMASIQRKLTNHPRYLKAMTMPNLVKFIGEHPECGVEITGNGDNVKLVFRNDPQHRFKILKLLDDDYLHSELTALDYESNSKNDPLDAKE
jgi:hypothetical protein